MPMPGYLRFSVTDTGIGIPQDKLQEVFESFSQAHASDTRKFGGTGLGLSISKQLVELMQGHISLDSVEGSGTTFSFEIPCPPGSAGRMQQLQTMQQIDGSILDGLRIILADDNEYNRIVARDTLLSKCQIHICEAANGTEALALLEAGTFDLILMDVQMPGMDGYEATRRIRSGFAPPKNKIPVIALTASVVRSDLDRCLEAGMDDYVPKPFTPAQLFAAIARAAGRPIRYLETPTAAPAKISVQAKQVTDLGYLEKFCEGDPKRIAKYIRLFLESSPALSDKIMVALDAGDWAEIARQVHGYKSGWLMMGMQETNKLAVSLEHRCLLGVDPEAIRKETLLLLGQLQQAARELSGNTRY